MAKNQFAILLTSKVDDNDYSWSGGATLTIKAVIVKLEDGKLRNPSDSAYGENAAVESGMADLEVTASLDAARVQNDPTSSLYGNDPQYRGMYSVDLRRATAMAATLKRIATREAKLASQFGHPTTFAERLARIASALDIETFLVWYTAPNKWGDYDSGVYDTRDASGAIGFIHNAVYQFKEAHKTVEPTVEVES